MINNCIHTRKCCLNYRGVARPLAHRGLTVPVFAASPKQSETRLQVEYILLALCRSKVPDLRWPFNL